MLLYLRDGRSRVRLTAFITAGTHTDTHTGTRSVLLMSDAILTLLITLSEADTSPEYDSTTWTKQK